MQKLIKFFLITLLLPFYSLSYSDNHVPDYSVMESFQCNFNEGKGMSDLIRVSDEWTKWMNQGNVSVPYNAWHVTSVFNNQKDFSFDTVWIGFTNNYEEMGVIQDEWAEKGARLQAKFDNVQSCPVHSMQYVYTVRSPKEQFSKGYMTVSGCTASEEATNEAFMLADEKMNTYLDENNFSNGATMRWFRGPGSGVDFPYDYLNVTVVPSFTEWGQNVDKIVTGAGAVSANLYGDLQSCDTPRVYRITYAGGHNPE